MTDFYRFPAMANLGDATLSNQAWKVLEEAQELVDAERESESEYAKDFEAMDVIHAAETYLRIKNYSEETLEMLRKLTIEKNRRRGYYD